VTQHRFDYERRNSLDHCAAMFCTCGGMLFLWGGNLYHVKDRTLVEPLRSAQRRATR
jgi:hypothetical protein